MPEIKKNYNKQDFEKTKGEFGTPVLVGTEPYSKRSNIDDDTKPLPKQLLTADELHEVLKGSETVVVDVADAGEHLQVRLDKSIIDALVPQVVKSTDTDSRLSVTTDESGSVISVTRLESEDIETPLHVRVEIEGSGTHYGCGLDVFAYDSSECFSTAKVLVNGTEKDVIAHLEDDGEIIIAIEGVTLSTESITVKYTTLF